MAERKSTIRLKCPKEQRRFSTGPTPKKLSKKHQFIKKFNQKKQAGFTFY